MTRGAYDTRKKQIIFDIIKKEHQQFTVKDIYNKTKGIGLTTVYRMILQLLNEGFLSKCVDKDNIIYYQYLEKCDKDNHFYLKCDNCGNMTHIDCDCIKEWFNHILIQHDFTINSKKIVINGICDKCKYNN